MYADVLSDKVKEIFISDMADIPEVATNHKFSLGYRIKRRRVISYYSKKTRHPRETIPRRVKLAVVVTVIFLVALIAGFVTYRYISGFYVEDNNEYALIKTDEEIESCNFINKKLYLDMDVDDFEFEVLVDDALNYTIRYYNENTYVVVTQIPINYFGDLRIDTEEALIKIDDAENDLEQYIICQSKNGELHFYCRFDTFIVEYNCNLPIDDAKKLVKSTKFK